MGRSDSLYARLPLWMQHGAVSTYGLYWHWLRFGPGYKSALSGYKAREGYSKEEWQRWQQENLQELLCTSASKVPYYRQTWGEGQKRAARAGCLSDLPLLNKQPVRANARSFVREDVSPKPRLLFHTSGSTGTPITSFWTVRELRNSLALREARSANWAAVSFRMPRATFSGRLVEPDPESRGPFYRFNFTEQQVYLSAFHLRPDTARLYVEALGKHRVQWLTGYAVSYYLLAKFILERKLSVPPLKAVITTSEKLTTEMRGVMEAAYGCRVYEEYSTVENALFASECERGRLHVSPDVGVVEILRPDGEPCEPGEVGEVVTTCLMRQYQPLIRYRLGDMAAWDTDDCPCGRTMPVIREVAGRIEDVVVGPDGRQMVRFHGIFVDQPHITEGQIIQEDTRRIRVKVVPAEGFQREDEQDVIRRVRQRLGPEVDVTVETVDFIPRTKSGKFQAVISTIAPAQG